MHFIEKNRNIDNMKISNSIEFKAIFLCTQNYFMIEKIPKLLLYNMVTNRQEQNKIRSYNVSSTV